MTWGWAEPQGRRHKFAANQWRIVQISGALYQGGARWGRRRGGDGGTVFCLFMEQSFTSPDTPPNLYPEGFQGNFIPVDAASRRGVGPDVGERDGEDGQLAPRVESLLDDTVGGVYLAHAGICDLDLRGSGQSLYAWSGRAGVFLDLIAGPALTDWKPKIGCIVEREEHAAEGEEGEANEEVAERSSSTSDRGLLGDRKAYLSAWDPSLMLRSTMSINL
ncbi:hypothetical protein C8R47DRAFT_1072022 [Mycena vitilis]|nr:hypothetical protein C8R47DRAFT_1072022 [Mycena vitilis]